VHVCVSAQRRHWCACDSAAYALRRAPCCVRGCVGVRARRGRRRRGGRRGADEPWPRRRRRGVRQRGARARAARLRRARRAVSHTPLRTAGAAASRPQRTGPGCATQFRSRALWHGAVVTRACAPRTG
jgi:hypothetical protein